MTADYSRFVTLASDKITEWGQAMTLRRITEGQHYDPHTGETPHISEAEETVYGMVLPVSNLSMSKIAKEGTGGSFDDGNFGLTSNQRRLVVLKAQGMAGPPAISDEIEFGGDVWRVSGSTTVAPDGTEIIYRVGLERA